MALLNAGQLTQGVATLMDDPAQTAFTDGYVLPFLNLAWDKIAIRASALGLKYDEQVVEILGVPAQTTNLTNYDDANSDLLASMIIPVKIDWKPQGAPDTEYQECEKVDELEDVDPGNNGNQEYEWRSSEIYIIASATPTDIRVRFKAYNVDFKDPVDGLIVGAGSMIIHKACELICSPAVRNNAAAMQYHAQQYNEDADEFESLVVKQQQRQKRAFGRMSGRTLRSSRVIARL